MILPEVLNLREVSLIRHANHPLTPILNTSDHVYERSAILYREPDVSRRRSPSLRCITTLSLGMKILRRMRRGRARFVVLPRGYWLYTPALPCGLNGMRKRHQSITRII